MASTSKKEEKKKKSGQDPDSEENLEKYKDLFYYDGSGEEEAGPSLAKLLKSESRLRLSREEKKKRTDLIRSLVAFWLLGFTNNFGYSFILSAALDILQRIESIDIPTEEPVKANVTTNERNCNEHSAGMILLTVSVPGLLLKMVLPFLPLCIKIRLIIIVVFNLVGYVMVGFVLNYIVILSGLILVSAASEIGEASFLQYGTYYSKFIIPAWSSGTGAAGFIGALSFSSIMAIFGFKVAIGSFLLTPLLMLAGFFTLPKIDPANSQFILDSRPGTSVSDLKKKFGIFPFIWPLMLFYFIAFYFTYLSTQGLFDMIYFENVSLDHNSQYRWFTTVFQFGNFIARTTGPYWGMKKVWIFSLLIFLHFLFALFEVIYMFTPWIYLSFVFVFLFGLCNGGSYVVTFFYIKSNIKSEYKQFTTTMCTIVSSTGILSAGGSSIPIHTAICKLSKPKRFLS